MYGEIGMFFFGWRCPNECKTSVYFTFVGKICGHMAQISYEHFEKKSGSYSHPPVLMRKTNLQISRLDQMLNLFNFDFQIHLFSPTPNLSMANAILQGTPG